MCNQNLVLYAHNCKNSANYHRSKYKHWAKLVTAVDTTKTNGYAFAGDFLRFESEHKVPAGSIIVEVCDKDITAYRAKADGGFTTIATAKTNSMSGFVETVAAALELEQQRKPDVAALKAEAEALKKRLAEIMEILAKEGEK